MSSERDQRTIWGGVVPVRIADAMGEAVRSWVERRRLRRVHLVWTSDFAGGGEGRTLLSALEAAGIAVFPFEHVGGASTAAVAEIVAAFHFDQCEAVIGVGAVVDAVKVAALMTGQGRPLADLAAEPEAVDPRGVAPSLVVATTLEDVARIGGASVVLDDAGCPFLLRHERLRPESVIYCPAKASDTDRAGVAALAFDAAAGDTGESERVAAQLDALLSGDVATAVAIAGLLERRIGALRTFATYAEVIGEVPPRRTTAAVLSGLLAGYPASADAAADVVARLGHDPHRARTELASLPLDALAHIDPRLLPVDLDPVLAVLKREIPVRGRRGGRAGAGRGRRTG